jgi:hypothetical protein
VIVEDLHNRIIHVITEVPVPFQQLTIYLSVNCPLFFGREFYAEDLVTEFLKNHFVPPQGELQIILPLWHLGTSMKCN